jgi:hypothetical protein
MLKMLQEYKQFMLSIMANAIAPYKRQEKQLHGIKGLLNNSKQIKEWCINNKCTYFEVLTAMVIIVNRLRCKWGKNQGRKMLKTELLRAKKS